MRGELANKLLMGGGGEKIAISSACFAWLSKIDGLEISNIFRADAKLMDES